MGTRWHILPIVTILTVAPAVMAQRAPDGTIPFDEGWTLAGERTAIVKDGARDVLQVETGFAHRRDVSLQDGTIDFDVRLTNRRSFVYVHFRAIDDGEREEFYLRPHKSGLPDAVQYAPVWQGRSAWQLHHGAGGTAAVEFTAGEWTHVRIAVQGTRAALFVGDLTKPRLVVPHLSREPRAGYVSLGGFVPADVPGKGPIATFANVVVRPGTVAFDFDAALKSSNATPVSGAAEEQTTLIRHWAVSRSFVLQEANRATLPDASTAAAFQPLETEPDGLLQLDRHVRVPVGARVTTAVARVNIVASRAGTYAFDLGFSDVATVFVNGTPLFRGDASYSYDRPRREGLIGYDQARLFLPLKAGENDLSIVVSDSFGGWGLMGRFVGTPQLSVQAR